MKGVKNVYSDGFLSR